MLLPRLEHVGPAPRLPGGAHPLGWEVLGYDLGALCDWLCHDLYRDAVRELGVATDGHGLLPDAATAHRVAAWAQARDDTAPALWFPARLTAWDLPPAAGPVGG
ncbi:hypothetical protein ATKI12_8540 [Kitasatospora sp. Ki12]|uniref:hypothetical protein n=1 Tax=Kitasatospora xanthocidica TaxID=83382 RepID=UPI001672A256|nr:hypothetical protein [Kitasatospora xanthocidica]GHF86555.1 hypothetical protein GCM10018790_75080 [Kitasatospora xanthocidica]